MKSPGKWSPRKRQLIFKRTKGSTKIIEHNHGIQLTNLKGNPNEWKRLREHLRNNKEEIEKHVAKGSVPLFGYPTVLYDALVSGTSGNRVAS